MALIGPSEILALRLDLNRWLRGDQSKGMIRVDIDGDENVDVYAKKGRRTTNSYLAAVLFFTHSENGEVAIDTRARPTNPERNVWSGKSGWFSASYGPFRRFEGGDLSLSKLFYSSQRLSRHLSIFGENAALTEVNQWFQELKFKSYEDESQKANLEHLVMFINQPGFLPYDVRLDSISSTGVHFVDGAGVTVELSDLSSGFTSVLSMTLELIRQLCATYGYHQVLGNGVTHTILSPGVVLIDEVDAHLHPSWQIQIGGWLCRMFPYIQFIVTTHSPLVCQAAIHGTVFRLPDPGSSESGRFVTEEEKSKLIYGNVLEAYSTRLFGTNIERSAEAKDALQRLAELNVAELYRDLTQEELTEQQNLRASMPTSAGELGNNL